MEIAKLKVTGVRCTPQKLGIITRAWLARKSLWSTPTRSGMA